MRNQSMKIKSAFAGTPYLMAERFYNGDIWVEKNEKVPGMSNSISLTNAEAKELVDMLQQLLRDK